MLRLNAQAPSSVLIFIFSCLSLVFFSQVSLAGSFIDSSFDEAEKAAEELHDRNGLHNEDGKKQIKNAQGTLSTGSTVKEVADYVGLGATTATIGSELYNLMDNDTDAKIAALNKQYQNALAQGNTVQAEILLTQLNAIKEQKKKIAKDQAGTQKSLATIQSVAGAANIGAAGASFYAAYTGYDAASDLAGANCDTTSKADECKKLNAIAAKKAKTAANTALYYGAGEMVVGAGSLYLASEHSKEADSLKSLSDDPLKDIPGAQASEVALFDSVAFTKCGSGASYRLLDSAPPPAVVSSTGVRSMGTSSMAANSPYQAIYDRIQCISSSSTSSTTSTSSTSSSASSSSTTTQCATDTLQCWDGSLVSRDPTQGCAFRPCPTITTSPIPVTNSGQPRFISSETSTTANTSGASKLQMDDVGKDIEKNQDKILNEH